MKDQPNIIYIVCHDLERMKGYYDHGFQSSNLSRFASQVAKFNATFYASLACNPSRACTWTGQYAHTKETLKWR